MPYSCAGCFATTHDCWVVAVLSWYVRALDRRINRLRMGRSRQGGLCRNQTRRRNKSKTSEHNETLDRRFYEEVFNQKKLGTFDELCAPAFVDHNPAPGQAPVYKG